MKGGRYPCFFSFLPRATCRTKRNPLRGLRKKTASRSPAGISIYITLSLFFRAASLFPSLHVCLVSLSLFLSSPSPHRVPDPLSCLSSRLFPTKDHGEDALARPTSLVTRLVLDPVAANIEETTRVLRGKKNIVADKSR